MLKCQIFLFKIDSFRSRRVFASALPDCPGDGRVNMVIVKIVFKKGEDSHARFQDLPAREEQSGESAEKRLALQRHRARDGLPGRKVDHG